MGRLVLGVAAPRIAGSRVVAAVVKPAPGSEKVRTTERHPVTVPPPGVAARPPLGPEVVPHERAAGRLTAPVIVGARALALPSATRGEGQDEAIGARPRPGPAAAAERRRGLVRVPGHVVPFVTGGVRPGRVFGPAQPTHGARTATEAQVVVLGAAGGRAPR